MRILYYSKENWEYNNLMRSINNTPSTLLRTFSSLYTISQHPSYTVDSEYSDKIILPKSIFFIIRNTHYPIPAIFILRSSKNHSKFAYCGVFEFTAEENAIYCPNWILRKVAKAGKYSSAEVRLEILQTSQNRPYVFPLVSKIDLTLDSDIDSNTCKKALMQYTVIIKGENISFCVKKGEIARAHISNVLPRNRCLLKSSNFDLNLIKKPVLTTMTEEDEKDRRPLFEYFQISLLSKSRVIDKRKQDSYTPWEHQVRPIKIEGENINLLPWESQNPLTDDQTSIVKLTQPIPDLPIVRKKHIKPAKTKRKKILSLAFPIITITESRPMTAIHKNCKFKSISYSPVNKL